MSSDSSLGDLGDCISSSEFRIALSLIFEDQNGVGSGPLVKKWKANGGRAAAMAGRLAAGQHAQW